MNACPPKTISVILSTYNSPDWLEKVLWGYAGQSHDAFEIVVADDGSDETTARRIDQMRLRTHLRIDHVWHEDQGFRKCAILNRAIERSRGDYLIFSDGDCVPRGDFVAQHHRHAQVGRFLSGGYIKLPRPLSHEISAEDIWTGRAFRWRFLKDRGLPMSAKAVRLVTNDTMAAVLNACTTTKPTWNGNNASGWKANLVAANGFDERMRYGGEDRELGERLTHAGVRGKHVRFQTVCLHLDHDRGYVGPDDLENNRQIRQQTRQHRSTRTAFGIIRDVVDQTRAA